MPWNAPAASPVLLGLDFGGTKIAVAVCGLAGDRLGSATIASGGEHGAQASFGAGIRAVRELLESAAPGAPLAAVEVSTFGIPFEDRVELAPAIGGWGQLAIARSCAPPSRGRPSRWPPTPRRPPWPRPAGAR
jgi:glucokinase